ncbi:cell envelope-related protein transcriptional attenuator [Beutenbergia cavernae DSM 12333]|uniref:Cell envelope-related protein transcriptional attenuator n=1 Tax=Beutenbergia cavernae (strain ATCC BAA-8 / DSM 12333 / CCUG 43141 / JCM 11478 / NBRC 16432 / NCIMB 13614 / HKI 0122) TaxID=471853 RepID=C5C121_BEUC1|nr:LCP family protein [Beutenbergia cavernae]ACQ79425.1 cell envelope-related protein transcriptional attenuator [Beutenbergia cavernae DSM 12333]
MPAGNAPRPAPAQHPVRNDPPRPTQPGPTGRPPTGGPPGAGRQHTRGTYIRRRITVVVIVVLVLLLAWPIGLLIWADGKIQHTEALSTAADTPGTTYLLAGSDSRDDGYLAGDTTSGQRTDTIMLLTVPPSGPTSLISLPRDTYVADIPGFGPGKLNAAFAHGGAPLLVQTVEGLTGITVDHYVEIGMGGVASLVDAVGGVELCYDADVNDPDSGMVWTAGCHHADGASALAFARMRKQDPLGDIGRAIRQQQVIEATTAAMNSPSNFVLPTRQVALIDAGTGALVTDPGTGILDLGRMALAFRTATGPEGVRGTPPIADPDYRPGGNLGSTVLLDPEAAPLFFQQVVDGTLPEPTPTPTDAG